MNVQGTDYLFPLNKLYSRLQGYYIDKEGQIYSTRGSRGGLSRLAGSQQHRFSNRYFTLDNASWEHSNLIRQAKAHADFAKETTPQAGKADAAGAAILSALQARGARVTTERAHAKTVDEAINSRGSIIASVVNGKFVFGSNPVVHTTQESVKAELARLATQNPGVRYVEFKINNTVVSGGLTWN